MFFNVNLIIHRNFHNSRINIDATNSLIEIKFKNFNSLDIVKNQHTVKNTCVKNNTKYVSNTKCKYIS